MNTLCLIKCFILGLVPIFGYAQNRFGEETKCIPMYQCNVFIDALPNRTSETVRFLRESRSGYVEDSLVHCNIMNLIARQDESGIPGLQDRIFDGNVTKNIDEFPWMAILEHNCDGVFINERHVLNCIVGNIKSAVADVFRVRLDEYNKDIEVDCVTRQSRNQGCYDLPQDIDIEEMIAHTEYIEVSNQYHDIGLLRLAKNVKYNDILYPICLPLNGGECSSPEENLTVTGWGYTEKKRDSCGGDSSGPLMSSIKFNVNVRFSGATSIIAWDELKINLKMKIFDIKFNLLICL